ncbi:MAG: ABC transporter substrate-binding protein [Acidimicrobiales bacterium]
MSSTFDRRSFLTHSAATIGGIAMAGTVVDGLLESVAGATVGVSTAKPKLGGSVTVGLISDVPNYHVFNGSQGKMDASGFCVANAVFDPLFVMAVNGQSWLPMLALSATPNANFTAWTIPLRQGIKFHNGDEFNAQVVVENYQAAAADPTVGLAIRPIIASVVATGAYEVVYNMVVPFSTYPTNLAEQQIAYMAHPSSFSPTYTGNPIGTGPFEFVSWQVGVESKWKKNTGYWRKDGAGRKLPYLDGINFKTIPDNATRNSALQSGDIDMILQQDGPSIAELLKLKNFNVRTDLADERDPSVNCLIMNTTGTLNQYFLWAGEFASALGVLGVYNYLQGLEAFGAALKAGASATAAAAAASTFLQGTANGGPGLSAAQAGSIVQYIVGGTSTAANPAPTQIQLADYAGTTGAVNPSTLKWDVTKKPVVNDVNIRKACAMAINRNTYFKAIDSSVGAVADGIYRHSSRFYQNPGYPAYNPSAAKALVDAYKSANNVSEVSFVIDIVSGDASAQKQFEFFQSQLAAVGISVTARESVQSTLINNVIYGEYDCATWNQFGGVDPSLNYVWFLSQPAGTAATAGGLSMPALPAGTFIAGAVNFAHLGDPAVESAMLTALASRPNSSAQINNWSSINSQFSKDFPYLFLDITVTAWAAAKNVQNWAVSTAADGVTRTLTFDGGSSRWDQIWVS